MKKLLGLFYDCKREPTWLTLALFAAIMIGVKCGAQ